MAATRPLVTEFDALTGKKTGKTFPLPAVFTAPIRSDIVHNVHRDMNKNHRQANGVNKFAGVMTSAESWGTGRAVARIPRVAGSGTHRSGQAAYGNMCRGGHMYSPKVTWRRWHRRIATNLRRYAVVSALAATAVPALVMARGHRIGSVPEVPLVLSVESLANIKKTKEAVKALKAVGVWADVERVINSKKVRPGQGKMRNRRHVQRKGPMIIYKEAAPVYRAFRNIPGVELCKVSALNLLKLAPGAHLGRLVMWTSDAFAELDKLFGTYTEKGAKKGFVLPRAKMTVTDLSRLIHSETVAKILTHKKKVAKFPLKKNPLRNFAAMVKLNPYAAARRRSTVIASLKRAGKYAEPADAKHSVKRVPKKVHAPKTKKEKIAAKRATNKKLRVQREAFAKALFA